MIATEDKPHIKMTNDPNSKGKPNIIFLDMDGVLCNPRACLAVGNIGGMFSYLDPIACLLVKRLCIECNARIVISSSWRLLCDRFTMSAILNAACGGLGDFMFLNSEDERWRTISNDKPGRGYEILDWVNKYSDDFNNFVILDDDSDMEPLMPSSVKCDVYDGIGFLQYYEAEKILMKGFTNG